MAIFLGEMTADFKLVIFDMDGVLVPIDSSWQYVHRAFKCDNEESYRKYLRGEIDYQEFMRSDICLWGSPSIDTIREILNQVPLAKGARDTIKALCEKGIRTAIISSGISLLAERIGRELGVDRVYANELLTDDEGHLTGEGVGIVPFGEKLKIIKRLREDEGVSPQETVAVGDNVYDFPPFGEIGLNIAFNPQDEESKMKADVFVEGKDLRLLLPWLTTGPPSKIILRLATGVREAESVVSALSPDNIKMPEGLYVKIFQEDGCIHVKVTSVLGLGTLLATVDDILSCSEVAISSIDVVESRVKAKTI